MSGQSKMGHGRRIALTPQAAAVVLAQRPIIETHFRVGMWVRQELCGYTPPPFPPQPAAVDRRRGVAAFIVAVLAWVSRVFGRKAGR